MKKLMVMTVLAILSVSFVMADEYFNVIDAVEYEYLLRNIDHNYDFDTREIVTFSSDHVPSYNDYLVFTHVQGGGIISIRVSWIGTTATVTRYFQGNFGDFYRFQPYEIAKSFLFPSDNAPIMSKIYVLDN
jgi:hypothetical protein